MNENVKQYLLGLFLGFVFSMLMLFPFFCSGCSTTGLQGKDAELISANARNVGRIESTAGSLAECLDRSKDRLEVVTRASERIADGVSRLEYLLDEYEREVGRLCDEIDRLRAQQEQVEN